MLCESIKMERDRVACIFDVGLILGFALLIIKTPAFVQSCEAERLGDQSEVSASPQLKQYSKSSTATLGCEFQLGR